MCALPHFLLSTLICAAASAQPKDAASDDIGPPTAYPVKEIIHLEPQEPKDPVLENLRLIQEQNAQLAEQIRALEKRLDERTEPEHKRLFEIGTGFAFRQGDVGRFVLEANLAWINATLILPGGWGVGLGPTIEAWRFRFRPFAVGLLWYFDRHHPLVVRAIPRDWDFLVSTAADFLVWRGLQVRFQVFWTFPNPGDVMDFASKRAAGHWDEFREDIDRNSWEASHADDAEDANVAWERSKDDVEDFASDLRDDGSIFNEAYKRAGKLPYFLIGIRWEF